MTSEDPRRKLIAEAMEARRKAEESHPAYLRGPLLRAYEALPVAVELIEELTAEVADLSTSWLLSTSDGSAWKRKHAEAEATIAEQAKEIEVLKDCCRILREEKRDAYDRGYKDSAADTIAAVLT